MTPSSSQTHDRPSSIWASVRQRKPSASRASGSRPSSSSCAAAHAGRSRARGGASAEWSQAHRSVESARMPIHVRAEPGDYAEAVLLPGDPLRAKYIAETYLDDVVQRNAERGLLGFTGSYKGKLVSVQGTGMGCPGASIVFEELIQLGCKKPLRVGTCGGLQPR